MPHFTDEEVKKIRVTDKDFINPYDNGSLRQFAGYNKNLSIFGESGKVDPDKIVLKEKKTYWFLGMLKQYAKNNPEAIKNMIKDNEDGTVTVRFYKTLSNGKKCPQDIVIDKTLPTNADSMHNPDQPWIGLIEKAYVAGVNRTFKAEIGGNPSIIKTGENIPNMQFLENPSPSSDVFSLFTPDKVVAGNSYMKLYDMDINSPQEAEDACIDNLKKMLPKNAVMTVTMNEGGRVLPVTRWDDKGIVIYDPLYETERTYSYKNLLGTEEKKQFENPNVQHDDAFLDIASIDINTPGTEDKRPVHDSLNIKYMQNTFSSMCKIAEGVQIENPDDEMEIKKLEKEVMKQLFVTSLDMIHQVYRGSKYTEEEMNRMKNRILTSHQWEEHIEKVVESYPNMMTSLHPFLHMEPTDRIKKAVSGDLADFAETNYNNEKDPENDNSTPNREIDYSIAGFASTYCQDKGEKFEEAYKEPRGYQYEDTMCRKKETSKDLYPDIQTKDDEPEVNISNVGNAPLEVCLETYELMKSYHHEMKKIRDCIAFEQDDYFKSEWKKEGDKGFDQAIYDKYKDIDRTEFLEYFEHFDITVPEYSVKNRHNDHGWEKLYSQDNKDEFKKYVQSEMATLASKCQYILAASRSKGHKHTPLDDMIQRIYDTNEQLNKGHVTSLNIKPIAERTKTNNKPVEPKKEPAGEIKNAGGVKPDEEPNKLNNEWLSDIRNAGNTDLNEEQIEAVNEPVNGIKDVGDEKQFKLQKNEPVGKVRTAEKTKKKPDKNAILAAKLRRYIDTPVESYDKAHEMLDTLSKTAMWNSATYNDLVFYLKQVDKYDKQNNEREKEKYLIKAIPKLEAYLKAKPEDLSFMSNKDSRAIKLQGATNVKNFLMKKLQAEGKDYDAYAKGKVKQNDKGTRGL